MTYKSYAKINLGLEVLYKRTDGYHEINTLFHQICLADIIDIEPHNSIKINCIPDLGIQQEQNLAFKACKLLQNNYDCKLKGAEIKIKKNIPTGAGLGGGSSNASTVLKGLNSMWNLNLSDTTLLDLAKELGSDVPFFIKGGTAIGKGRGEVLEFVDFKLPYHILLIFPEVKISTKVAYEKLNRSSEISSGSDFKKILDDIADSNKINTVLKNDFEETVFASHPNLKNLKEKILLNGALYSQMSGSGSTIFGLFNDIKILQKFESVLANYHTHVCIENTNL